MRVVIQKVLEASVKIGGQVHASIGPGLLIFAGWEASDLPEDNEWMAQKISRMRLFEDHEGVMNRSIMECGGQFLVISQFTLHAATKKATAPAISEPPIHAFPSLCMKTFWTSCGMPQTCR